MPDIRIVPNNAGMAFTSSLNFTETITQTASGSLVIYGSGSLGRSEIFAVDGANGRLFEVTDDLSNSLFSVNTIAGLPVIEAFANNQVVMGSYGNNFGLGLGSNTVVESTSVASSIQLIPSSSYGGGPLIQTGPNGRIRPASTGDRLELEGNALYLNRAFGASIIVGGTMSMQTNNITFSNATSTGIQDAAGSGWIRPRDTSNNLHIRTNVGGIYLDTNDVIYFRNINGTNRAYIDSTNGGGRVMDTTLYANAAALNQSLTTSATPTFGGLTVGAGVATGRSSWGAFTNANIILTSSTSDSTGNCGIEFRSGNNYPSDGASIYFENNAGGTSERAKLTLRVENDQEDFMELRAGRIDINSNTISGGGQATAVNFQSGGSTVAYITSGGAIYARSGNLVKDFGNSTYTTSFTGVSSVTVTHNLGSKDVMVMCYDSSDEMFWPSSIVTTSTSVVTITFAANRTGRVVVLR